jgi:competence protein ComEA
VRGEFGPEEAEAPDSSELERKTRPRISREQFAWLVVVFLLGLAAGALIVSLSGRSSSSPIIISTAVPPSTLEPTPLPGPIKVFVSGEVLNPAVYELPAGAIIQDLVRSAGGFTELAGQDVVNLALTLSDGMHIHVPGQEEEISIPVVSGGAGTGGLSDDGTVNINMATLQDLETLPGIGPSLAQAIIDYRELNGAFTQLEDILEVPGIGPAKFEGLKDLITVN